MKKLLLLPFFALLMLMSCQQEVVDVTVPAEAEALVASSTLTSLVASTSIKDGSADNIIDKANCLSVDLPVTVVVNGVEIIIDSKEDFAVIEAIFNEFDDDIDNYLRACVKTNRAEFMNPLWGGLSIASIAGELVTAATNTAMYTYEIAPVATLIESTIFLANP